MKVVCIQEHISELCCWMMIYSRTKILNQNSIWNELFVSNSDLMFKSKRLSSTVEAYSCIFISNSCESDVSVKKFKIFKI